MYILIVVHPITQIGLLNDANIIKKILSDHTVIIIDKNEIVADIVFDFVIMIEHIFGNIFDTIKYKKILFIPNLEMLYDWDIKNINRVDIIIAKTKQTKPFFESLDIKLPKIVYTKFTSPCTVSDIKKNNNIVIHFSGTSYTKNTTAVLKTWVKNNYFTNENKDIILVITKKIWHKTELEKEGNSFWLSLNPVNVDSILDRKVSAQQVNNIYIVSYFEKEDYEYFLNSAFIHLCPSLMEGYGHYINEGRCRKAIVLTTNASPMNELITDKKQLIKVEHKIPHHKDHFNNWIYKSKYVSNRISIEDFGIKIKYFINGEHSNNLKKQYDDFVADSKYFNDSFLKIINS